MNLIFLKRAVYSLYFSKAGIYTHNCLTSIRNFAKNFAVVIQMKQLCMLEWSCVVETSAGFVLLFFKTGSASWELVEGVHRACVPYQNQLRFWLD